MPFQIVRNNIAEMEVDAIVNTANPLPVVGGGCDTAVHRAAGPELMEARRPYGRLEIGKPVITPGFGLKAKYVIHAAGPVWQGGSAGEEEQLARCYTACMQLADENHCESMAFPLLSAGSYGFPADKAMHIALEAISGFLMAHEMKVFLAVLGGKPLELSNSLFSDVKAYVDEHYAKQLEEEEYAVYGRPGTRRGRRGSFVPEIPLEPGYVPDDLSRKKDLFGEKRLPTLEELLSRQEEDFPTRMMRFIIQKDLNEKAVYDAANIDRKLFSKIRCGKGYVPKKGTALALCIGMKLDLEETEELLRTAGYSLTFSDKRDIIVRFFILKKKYDIGDIETCICEAGLPCLVSIL